MNKFSNTGFFFNYLALYLAMYFIATIQRALSRTGRFFLTHYKRYTLQFLFEEAKLEIIIYIHHAFVSRFKLT